MQYTLHKMKGRYFSAALKISTPVFFGYIAIGIPLGLMVVNAGYPWWMAPFMSVIMYAGAGEYMAIGLFASGAPLSAILITELFVNIRHVVYGLSLITPFKGTGKWKPFLIFALTDETYALLTGVEKPEEADAGPFYAAIAALDYLYWITGSLLGAVAETVLPLSFEGVDFALTALFAVLLLEQLIKTKDVFPAAAGAAVTAGAIALSRLGLLGAQHVLITSICMGIFVLVFFRHGKTPANKA